MKAVAAKKRKKGSTMTAKEKEDQEDKELEEKCEKWCGRVIKLAIFLPMLLNFVLLPAFEFVGRPTMVLDDRVDLAGTQAIVTGGCGAIGRHTAALLAEAGASVVLGCRSPSADAARDALALVEQSSGEGVALDHAVWPLDLDDAASVMRFVARFRAERAAGDEALPLKLLLNNAGTRSACGVTAAGVESAFSSNYLGHFLLTKLLLPTLSAAKPSRIVSVACREGFLRPAAWRDGKVAAWLSRPMPLAEDVDVSSGAVIASVDELGALTLERCNPAAAYANSKLALLAFSAELERRLRRSGDRNAGVVSHALNPNTIASGFAASGTIVAKSSMRAKVMGYFPPFWLLKKFFGKVSGATTRSVEHGARAVFHVATARALAKRGGFYDDTFGAFANCGKAAATCGRVDREWEPAAMRSGGVELYRSSNALVKQILAADSEEEAEA